MKNRFIKLLLMSLIIVPCLFVGAACKNQKKDEVIGIVVELEAGSLFTMDGNVITVPYGGKVELSQDDFVVSKQYKSGKRVQLAIKVGDSDGFVYESNLPSGNVTLAGNYRLKFTYKDFETVVVNVNVSKLNVDMSNVCWNYNQSFVYDGEEKSVELINLPEGVSVVYFGTKSAVNAGLYSVRAEFTYKDNVNYNQIPNLYLDWRIDRGEINISTLSMVEKVYTGDTLNAEVDLSLLPEDIDIKSMSGEKTKVDVGTYNVEIVIQKIGENANNFKQKNINVQWRIKPATYNSVGSVTMAAEYDYTYTGKEQEVELDFSLLDEDVEVKSVSGVKGVNAGKYSVIVELDYVGQNSNYDSAATIVLKDAWEIKKVPFKITAKDSTITYGERVKFSGYEYYNNFVNNETIDVFEGSIRLFCDDYQIGDDVGSYDILIGGVTAENYDIICEKGVLSVVAKQITIQPSKTIIYGDEVPRVDELDISVNGLVGEDSLMDFSGVLSINTCEYEKGSPVKVGGYSISVYGLNNRNYRIQYLSGALIVEPKQISIKPNDIEISYEDNIDGSGYVVVGLVGDDQASDVVSGSATYNFGGYVGGESGVGEYVISIAGLSSNDNYEIIEYLTGKLTVLPKVIMVDALAWQDASNLVYCGQEIKPEILSVPRGVKVEYEYQNENILIEDFKNAGNYIAKATISALNQNYAIENTILYLNYTIKKAPLRIKANDCDIEYGDNGNNNGYVITGFVGNETVDELTGNLKFEYMHAGTTTSYIAGDDVGEYDIICKGFSSDNYEITYENGVLTVNKIVVTIIPETQYLTYGDDMVESVRFEVVGLLDVELLEGEVAIDSCEYVKGMSPNFNGYKYTLKGLSSNNCDIIYQEGLIYVNPAVLTIKPNDVTISVGQENFEVGYTVSGLVNGDSEDVLRTVVEFEFVDYISGESGAGEYVIKIKNNLYAGSNYIIMTELGKLIVE